MEKRQSSGRPYLIHESGKHQTKDQSFSSFKRDGMPIVRSTQSLELAFHRDERHGLNGRLA